MLRRPTRSTRTDTRFPSTTLFRSYPLERERIGGIASLDWRPSDTTPLWARGLYSKFTENEYRPRFRLDFATQAQRDNGTVTLTPDGLTGVSKVNEQRSDLRLEYKEKSVLVGMTGGKTEANDWTFDYVPARSHNAVVDSNQLGHIPHKSGKRPSP